ncbi:P-loop containing nucleoside triphosphate hydrolase protein [Xylaria nigripes]|nr:P-loop containing nucleoside triphosphate hydrolase protein [Xylaria nigripes]
MTLRDIVVTRRTATTMPREIDSLPTSAHVRPKKLIVLSASRSGTHGIYLALKELGYKPYHMAEVMATGAPALKILTDGACAEMVHDGKPYGREEFDKWFADYDALVEIPFFMPRSIVKAYPDAKFFLTERDPEKWATSYLNTLGMATRRFNQFPLSVCKYFDTFSFYMGQMSTRVTDYHTNNFGVSGSDESRQALAQYYKEYIAEIKRLVPPEQLKVCRLEDGFGWNELCPYLGMPIPNTPWPALNTPEEFESVVKPKVLAAIGKGMVGVTTIMGAAAVGIWYVKERLSILLT